MAPASILCIEDDPGVSELIKEILTGEGHEVTVASTGTEGLAAIRDQPDLVLCDIDMPDLTGFDILREIRRDGLLPLSTPFMFITALSQRTNQLQAYELGCDDFITKPLDFELLLPRIRHRLTSAPRHAGAEDFKLTERELEILTWVARGKSSPAVATILGVTERTINFHLDNIYRKMAVASRTQAAVKATLMGLIEP